MRMIFLIEIATFVLTTKSFDPNPKPCRYGYGGKPFFRFPMDNLRARREDRGHLALYTAHFQRWGAAGPAGERSAALEAGALLGALHTAERLWLAAQGRPPLPVLVQEALALLWPAL